jgi:hypothetical protein
MANKQIYISCPIAVHQYTFDEYIDLINDHKGFTARYWERGGEYSQTYFDSSDAFVFVLPDNKFKASNHELPIGLKRELARAFALGKKIFIGYQTRSGEYAFYLAKTNGRDIEGVPGTTNEIYKLANLDVVTTKYDPTTFKETTYLNGEEVSTDTKYTFDERALLLLA